DSGAPPGFRPHVFDAVLLAWTAVALAVALRLRGKEKRLEYRRARRAVTAVVLFAGLAALPGCGEAGAGSARSWAAREEAELAAAAKDAADAATAATAAADKKWQAAVDGWAKLVAAPGETVDAVVLREEADVRDRLRGVAAEARLADRLAKDAEEQRAKLADARA